MVDGGRLSVSAPCRVAISSLAGWEYGRTIEHKGRRRAGPLVLGKPLRRHGDSVVIGANRSEKASFC